MSHFPVLGEQSGTFYERINKYRKWHNDMIQSIKKKKSPFESNQMPFLNIHLATCTQLSIVTV